MLKKNIAKLLVFAMILSMLPFSAVTAGAEDAPAGKTAKLSDYVTVKDAYVVKNAAGYKLEADTNSSTFGPNSTAVTPGSVKVYFTVELKEKDGKKPAGLWVKQDTNELDFNSNGQSASNKKGSYTVADDTYSIVCDVGVTEKTEPNDVQFTLTAVDADDGTVASGIITLKIKAETGSNPPGPGDDKKVDYRVTLDTETAEEVKEIEVEAEKTETLVAHGEYKVAGDTDTDYDVDEDAEIAWTSGNDKIASVSNGVVTGVAQGETTITATWTAKNVSATCKVTVTPAGTGTPTYLVSVENDIQHGKVLVTRKTGVPDDDAYKFAATEQISFTVEADDHYELSALNVYKTGDDTVKVDYNKQTAPNDNAYTFTMPAYPVTISATFVEADEGIKNVPITLDLGDIADGHALREATTDVKGVILETTWKDEAGNTLNAFVAGVNKYTITVTADVDNGYKLAKDATYTMGVDTKLLTGPVQGEVSLTPRKRAVTFKPNEPGVSVGASPAGGLLTIAGTSVAKWYLITEGKIDLLTSGTATAYVIAKGGEDGIIKIPCEEGVTLTIKEMDGDDKAAAEASTAVTFVSGLTAKSGTIYTEGEAVSSYSEVSTSPSPLDDNIDEETEDGAVRVRRVDFKPNEQGVTVGASPAGGLLTISGTSSSKWYLVTEGKQDLLTGGTATGYVIVKGVDNDIIKIPCEEGVTLTIKEMDGDDKAAAESSTADTFVSGLTAKSGTIYTEERN